MAFVFSTVFLAADDIIWPFRAFTYFMPLKFTFSTMLYQHFTGINWGGAVLDATNAKGFSCLATGGNCCCGRSPSSSSSSPSSGRRRRP
jgi:hypothetical protein